ncbi:probable GPI-anchored adhesin-like protein PGA55 isoform X2 [Oncorhynchus kisutch]|uniref:probable GPI-anchored adhesin-like protein PGA55 isoform X2 n=1 Tax=Oncorhynchus kisutch TaxID=8019 RepID=UPI0012DFCD5C|nr:probable GPI-anchored adhesin-like protein PGA55 isoform X2 [Oncorhynchus kisutch]
MKRVMNLSEENRTVVVSGVPDTLSSSRMADKLVIHFQSSRSHGGDVENIKYPTSFKGVAFVTFENTRDAEMVIRKKQIMCDKEFPQDYPITVFRFTQDVLFYVNAKVDLSICGDEEQQETLIQSLQSAHRSVRICLLPNQEGKASVEGPFSAIRDLREDLLQRATASSSSHPGEKHRAPSSSGYSLTSVAAGNGVSQVSSSHPGEKHRAPSSSGYSLASVAAGNGVSQVSSSHPGEKHGAPLSSGYSLASVAAGNGVSQVSSSHPGEKHGAPLSSGYSLTSVAAGNGVSQVSSSHPGEKHRAPSSSGYSLASVAAGNEVSQVSSSHPGEKHGAPLSSGYSLASVAAGNGVSQVSSSHPGEKHGAPLSSGYSLASVAVGNGVSQVSSSHAWERHRAPSPSSHDHSPSSVVAESRSSRVRPGDGAEVDFRVSCYTWEKKNRAADHSLSSSVAGGSVASTINQSLEKHRRAAPSSSDHSLSSMASGSGESKVISSSHTLEKYIAPSSHNQSLPSPVAAGTSKVSSGGDVDMEEESTWVDTNIFLYIQRFSKDQFDQCFRNHGVSAVFDDNDVADLTLISLRGRRDSKGLSEVQLTISELTDLVAVWQSTLRIHTIDYRRQDLRERKRLLQICAEVNNIYEDVLYVQKELSVRVIGPSISSHLFTEWVKDRRDQPHKEDFM